MVSDKTAVVIVILSCSIIASVFYIKYRSMYLEDDIKRAKIELVRCKKANSLLKAELQALTNPTRIQHLTDKYIGDAMQPATAVDEDIDGYCSSYDEKKVEKLTELIGEEEK